MKLNSYEVTIAAYEESMLDEEMVIFVREYHKIIVLNQTAVSIWKYILLCYERNLDLDTSDIIRAISSEYVDSIPNETILSNDINEAIQLFFDSSLLLYSEKKGGEM